jgi:hypothetical protein
LGTLVLTAALVTCFTAYVNRRQAQHARQRVDPVPQPPRAGDPITVARV